MGNLVVTQSVMIVLPYYEGSYYPMIFGEVSNTGNKPVEFNSGLLEIFDPDGNSLAYSDIYYCYPPVLQPGETGYVYTYNYVEAPSAETVSDFMLTVTGKGSIEHSILGLSASAKYEQRSDDYGTYDYLVAQVVNDTDQPIGYGEVVFAMKDADGSLLYVTSTSWNWYNVSLLPGSSVEVALQMDASFLTYMQENGIVPASVEAIAYCSSYIY